MPNNWEHTLFKYMTLRLMAAKYAYYILSEPYIKDYAYDDDERAWFALGRKLGLLKEDEISPCIDFDFKHPLAEDAKLLGTYLVNPSGGNSGAYMELLTRYGMGGPNE